ncbi:hypothetical protein F0562_035882 [Nyssa sinensis]|uniref:BHLH domain-containing protein n=1 Tax=Nyssa sinensis TaxID=561372 RepID=A0A5J5AGD7_9ASTE|nr:hypothetical protein F0562_035882 [Nyssa sinensis]
MKQNLIHLEKRSVAMEGEDDQMDMMMMMIEMDKLSDFSEPYNDVAEMPTMEFTGGSSSPDVASPTFINIVPSMKSAVGTAPVQEPPAPAPALPFLSHASAGRWRIPAESQKRNPTAAMREMIFAIAAMQPIHIDQDSVKPPKRRNVKISKDPQSVAARHRRERISERIRILQRLVPGGTKMDTASMLDEAIHYMKFLKTQVQSLERAAAAANRPTSIGFPLAVSNGSYLPIAKPYQPAQNVQY